MATEFRVQRQVEFADTDMAGIVHFANFFRYMESAEHAFLRAAGLSVHTTIGGVTYSWPRVHVECDFRSPLRFEDRVEIVLRVLERRAKTVRYGFQFLNLKSGALVAEGNVVVACVTIDERGELCAVTIPPDMARRIDGAEPLAS